MATPQTDIVRSLIKSIKAIQMYGVQHPSSKNFYEPLTAKLSAYLKEERELSFQVEQFAMMHAGKVIHEDFEKETSLPFRLFRDGIRKISFSEGITEEEMIAFLTCVSRVSRDYDVALGLWEADLFHITFYVIEEEEELHYATPKQTIYDIDYDAKTEEIIRREHVDMRTPIDADVTPEEINVLKTDVSNVERFSVIPTVIATLINFLKTEQSQEIMDSLTELLGRCVDNRDFLNARLIVEKVKEYTGINTIDKFENETTIMAFTDLVNIASEETFNEFIAFIGLFSKKSIPFFIKLMAQVKRPDRLYAPRNRIAYIAQDDVVPVSNFLNSKDVPTVVNAVAIIGLMRSKDTTTLLEPLMQHAHPDVRIEIISALENNGNGHHIARFLDDINPDVRIKALQALTRISYPQLAEELIRRIKSKDFRSLEFPEQKEYFSCLIANGSKEIGRELDKILNKWVLFGRKRYQTMRELAAMALASMDNPGALQILHQGLKKRNKYIRRACAKALKQK
jgi:HEAT repeat protein